MTEEILSSDEIDELMNSSSDSSNGNLEQEDLFELVDFSNAHGHSLMTFPGFNSLNELFELEMSNSLLNFLRRKVTVEILSPKLVTYEDYIENLNQPTSFNVLEFTEQHSLVFVTLSAELLYCIVTYLFGGFLEDEPTLPDRFGKMEERISRSLIENIMKTFCKTWAGVQKFEYTILQLMLKSNPINLLNEQDMLLVCGYRVTVLGYSGVFDIALETALLEALKPEMKKNKLRNVNQSEERKWRNKLYETMMDVDVELISRFPDMDIQFEDLINLKVGDVVSLDDPNFANVFIEEIKLFTASCGASKGSRVIEILQQIKY